MKEFWRLQKLQLILDQVEFIQTLPIGLLSDIIFIEQFNNKLIEIEKC
jgi:hypothetical protein